MATPSNNSKALRAKIAKLEKQVAQLEQENEVLRDLCDEGQHELEDLRDRNIDLQVEVDELREELEQLRSEQMDGHYNGVFVGTPNRWHFHRPDCIYVQGRRVIRFASHEAAVAAGRKPCKTCKA